MSNVVQGCYLYSRWRGEFEIHEGDVYASKFVGTSYFKYNAGRKEKRIRCGPEPNIIYNRVLWMTERNDDLARELFIAHEEDCVKELQLKIAWHKKNILKIKNEMEKETT